MSEREEYAKALGIKVDGRWSAERLEQEIAKAEDEATKPALAPEPAPKVETVRVKVLRDYWTDEIGDDGLPKRVVAGTIRVVSAMEAVDLIEAGAVERVR